MPNTRVGLYSKARKRATSKLRERSPSDGSSNLQAPSPRDARLQARAAAAAELLESLSEEEADNDPISDDAISTDPTTRMINYDDEALVYPTGTAVVNGDDDNGNDDIDGVNDKGQEEGNNEGEDDIDDVDEGEGEDEDEDEGEDDDEDDDDSEDADLDDEDEDVVSLVVPASWTNSESARIPR